MRKVNLSPVNTLGLSVGTLFHKVLLTLKDRLTLGIPIDMVNDWFYTLNIRQCLSYVYRFTK